MSIKAKWRPRLALVVAGVIGVVLCLPLASLLYFNFYGKQLVQQTEEALIGQAAVMAAQFALSFEAFGGDPRLGRPLPEDARPDPDKLYHPIFPTLSLGYNAIGAERPDPQLSYRPALPVYDQIGQALSDVSKAAQLTTLAGFRAIDPFGQVVGGSGELGYNLGQIPEVRRALDGYPVTLLRERVSDEPDPPIWSISRRTDFRVFVALPVIVEAHVVGAVYVSRTPGNVVQAMFQERANLLKAGLSILAAAGLIGFVFWRFITRPIHGLIAQTQIVSEAGPDEMAPLKHYGTREVAKLGGSFLAMTETLHQRAQSIQTYTNHVTHELKSPLTSILGATELLNDPDAKLSDAARAKFITNLGEDANRMTVLLDKLAQLAAAKGAVHDGAIDPAQIMQELALRFPELDLEGEFDGGLVGLSAENLTIVLTHLIENAAQHGATSVWLQQRDGVLTVSDNGPGISDQNKSRIFDPFFTTRRDDGGTGMGLGIAEAMITSAGGQIRLVPSKTGASFEITFAEF